jgi:hypothetical protein
LESFFKNRKLLIATKHQKEKVIAPIVERELGVTCFIDNTLDTDILGTFTGEVERELDPVSTVREKCLQAMKLNNCDLGIASEGSFGPHPSIFFVNADDEFLIFIDTLNNVEVIVREISTTTNFNGKQVQNQKELIEFADQIGFPTHGLILSKLKDEKTEIHKGITDIENLKNSFELLWAKYNSVYVETDMRAMFNPTRMNVIKNATKKLVQKIKSTCPQCKTPGFGITDSKKGLKCSLCGLPTDSILSYIYICNHCQFSKEEIYPLNKTTEDPMYCNNCNP